MKKAIETQLREENQRLREMLDAACRVSNTLTLRFEVAYYKNKSTLTVTAPMAWEEKDWAGMIATQMRLLGYGEEHLQPQEELGK